MRRRADTLDAVLEDTAPARRFSSLSDGERCCDEQIEGGSASDFKCFTCTIKGITCTPGRRGSLRLASGQRTFPEVGAGRARPLM